MALRVSSKRRVLAATASSAAVLVAVALAGGFFGHLHPAFDSLTHFRLHLVALGVILGLIALIAAKGAARIPAALSLAFSVFCGFVVAPYLPAFATQPAAAASAARYTLLQMNVLYDSDLTPALSLIGRLQPDIVTLEEVTAQKRQQMTGLAATYPFQTWCGESVDGGGVAIISKRPFLGDEAVCRPGDGFVAQRVDFNGQPVTVVAEHLLWPWPKGQRWQVAALKRPLALLAPPILVAGDFNAAAWSATVQNYAAASGTHPVDGIGPSFLPIWLPNVLTPIFGLPIDNVLVSDRIHVTSIGIGPATASDHRPVVATFSIAPANASSETVTAARSPSSERGG